MNAKKYNEIIHKTSIEVAEMFMLKKFGKIKPYSGRTFEMFKDIRDAVFKGINMTMNKLTYEKIKENDGKN